MHLTTLLPVALALVLPALALPQWGNFPNPSGSASSTANDITNKAACKTLTVIFARGTGERGNIGSVIGPPLLKALKTELNNDVSFQGVPYAAAQSGNFQQGGNGGQLAADLVKQALAQCPATKIVLSGYSQGGFVVHRAGGLSAAYAKSIAGAVIFGDPQNGSPVANVPELKQFCAQGDGVCSTPRTYAIGGPHLSYGKNAAEAAAWIAALL